MSEALADHVHRHIATGVRLGIDICVAARFVTRIAFVNRVADVWTLYIAEHASFWYHRLRPQGGARTETCAEFDDTAMQQITIRTNVDAAKAERLLLGVNPTSNKFDRTVDPAPTDTRSTSRKKDLMVYI